MSSGEAAPLVVLVDDEPPQVDWLRQDLDDARAVDVALVEPENLTEAHLREGGIFLLDMFLKTWPGRDKVAPAARVYDGIALAGVIRAHALREKRPAPVIALHTGHAGDFSSLPDEIREHALARAHNLEWVFLKNDSRSEVPTPDRVLALAAARERLPDQWPAEHGNDELLAVLGASPDELGEILDCWPPNGDVGSDTAGIAVLRWLLHRILPYPCFLLDQRYVAARLGMSCTSLGAAAKAGGELGAALEDARYDGVLATFDGPRWWRSRIERLRWQFATGPRPGGAAELAAHTSAALEPASAENGVIVLASDYTPRQDPVPLAHAVRIRLDDWPPYAEDAWAAIEDVAEDKRFAARVLPMDRDRLDGRA
jgi:hypothetical protein